MRLLFIISLLIKAVQKNSLTNIFIGIWQYEPLIIVYTKPASKQLDSKNTDCKAEMAIFAATH
jgi:hypothetical protein